MARILYFSRDYTPHDHRFLYALAQTEHKIFYLRLEQRDHILENRPLPPEKEILQWAGGEQPTSYHAYPRLLNSLKEIIKKIQPHLIQAGPLQTCAFLVALTGFKPLISTSWGYDLLQDVNRSEFHRWITQYVLKRSTVMVGDCLTIRRIAVSLGMPDQQIITFPWGVDLQHFSYHPMPVEKNGQAPFTLLSTRSWEPIYGVDTIAKAFVLANQQRAGMRLVMLGNGSQASVLHHILEKAKNQVFMPGQIQQNDLPHYYHQSDVYLSASHSDGTSISLLEAMACGRPVIVSDIPGNQEWVEPGVQGWLFAEDNHEHLSDAIIMAFDQRSQLQEMGLAARKLAEQRADWNKNFPHLLEAYQLALDS